MAAPRTRLPCILLTLLLATAAVNKHEDPHEHAAALKKREVNSRHADAGKKQVKITFTNYLPVAGGHRLWWDGGVGRQHQADLGYVKQTYIAGTFEGHRWWVENEDHETVWQMVVDEGKGYNQHVAISKDRSVKRTISSIIEHPELYDLHRLDSDYGAKHDHHGCADPVLVDDVVRVRAIGSEGAPAWVAQEDGLLSAAHDSRTMNHQIWKVESERTAGPLWTGDYVYFLGEGAEGPAYIDAPPPQGRGIAPLAARWKDRGDWQKFVIHKGEELDAHPLSAVCYGEELFLQTHYGTFVDTHQGRVLARWKHRGDWQKVAFERVGAEAGHGGEL